MFQALGTKGKGNVRADENEVAVAAGEQLRDQSLGRTLGLGEGTKRSPSSSGRLWAAFPLAKKWGKSPRGPASCVVSLPRDFPSQITPNPNPGVCLGLLLPWGQLGLGLRGRTDGIVAFRGFNGVKNPPGCDISGAAPSGGAEELPPHCPGGTF